MTEAKRGPGRPRQVVHNAQDASMSNAVDQDSSREAYMPAGSKHSKVMNTVFINPSDSVAGKKEVFLIKTWEDGTLFYIDPDHLDTIDRKRLTRALKRANKSGVELWTVLKDTTLSNSKNALEYFHQLVRTFKPEGANSAPTAAQITNRVKRAEEGFIERGGLSDSNGSDAPNSLL